MTGDGPPHESPGNSTPWSGDGSQRPEESIGAGGDEPARQDGPSSVGEGGPDVDDLEARLEQQEASLQQVIDRYEAVLEEQRTDVRDGRQAVRGHEGLLGREGLLETTRIRVDRFVTDVKSRLQAPRR